MQGEAKNHGLSTNNARLEGIFESRLYKPVLNKRQTCIIVCQGFYEWKTVGVDSKQKKQPYLIFPSQEQDVKIAEESNWTTETNWSVDEGWKGPKMLKMAGIYDTWKNSKDVCVFWSSRLNFESNNIYQFFQG